MAFNSSPEVALEKEEMRVAAVWDAAEKLGADGAVMVYLMPGGTIGFASYARRESCAETKALADQLYDAAMKWFRDEAW